MCIIFIKKYNILVDNEDYNIISSFKWHIMKCKSNLLYATGRPIHYKQKMLMHRYIYFVNDINIPNLMEIDHINGNGLDNRKKNLRLLSHKDNMLNRKSPQINNKLGISGVYYNEKSKKYRSYVSINGKFIHIGMYNTIKEAIKARKKFIRKNNLNIKTLIRR